MFVKILDCGAERKSGLCHIPVAVGITPACPSPQTPAAGEAGGLQAILKMAKYVGHKNGKACGNRGMALRLTWLPMIF